MPTGGFPLGNQSKTPNATSGQNHVPVAVPICSKYATMKNIIKKKSCDFFAKKRMTKKIIE